MLWQMQSQKLTLSFSLYGYTCIEPDTHEQCHVSAHMSSPSHVAATIGSVQCLQTLQAYGASLSLKSKYGATPLYEAAANGNAGGCDYH